MLKSERSFAGIGIDCELALVDGNGRRTADSCGPDVEDSQLCVALWSATVHSYEVRVHSIANDPLLFVSHGGEIIRDAFPVEPPVRRDLDKAKPAAGRNGIVYRVASRSQETEDGIVNQADFEARMRATSLYEKGKPPPVALPDEPAFKGFAKLRCDV